MRIDIEARKTKCRRKERAFDFGAPEATLERHSQKGNGATGPTKNLMDGTPPTKLLPAVLVLAARLPA